MLPRKMGPLMSHLRRLLSELSMNPPFLVAMRSATVSVFVFAVAGFFADDFMIYDLLGKTVRSPAFRPQASATDPFRETKPFRLKAGLRTVFHRFSASLIAT